MLPEEAGSRTHILVPSALEMWDGVTAAAPRSPRIEPCPEAGGEAGRGVPARMQLLETALLPCPTSGASLFHDCPQHLQRSRKRRFCVRYLLLPVPLGEITTAGSSSRQRPPRERRESREIASRFAGTTSLLRSSEPQSVCKAQTPSRAEQLGRVLS